MIDDKTIGWRKKIVGFKELIDLQTGELKIANEIHRYDVDVNWEKVWLKNLLYAIDIVSDKAYKVLKYFLENRNYENKVLANKEMVIRHTDVSRATVYRVIDKLVEADIIKELELGFQINPNIIFNSAEAKKKKIKRLDVVISYHNIKVRNRETYELQE